MRAHELTQIDREGEREGSHTLTQTHTYTSTLAYIHT